MNRILAAAAKLPIDEQADFVKDCIELQSELKHLNKNNMAKVSVFGQQSTEKRKELKKIEFVKTLTSNGTVLNAIRAPESWSNVQLLRRVDDEIYDIILAWDDNCTDMPIVYLGHWNDGVV